MEEMVNLIVSNGMSVVIIAYFLFKDYKFNGQICDMLGKISDVLSKLETWHAAEAGDRNG